MVLEALASFNQWYVDNIVMNAGYLFLAAITVFFGVPAISKVIRKRKYNNARSDLDDYLKRKWR